MNDQVILVDLHDRVLGTAEKIKAHQEGWLHRAFSIFLFRRLPGHAPIEVLLQKRNPFKYHSANLWSNSCCGHPRIHETVQQAASRRLQEELGLRIILHPVGTFHYVAAPDQKLIENELDHVFIGWMSHERLVFDAEEIQDVSWMDVHILMKKLSHTPYEFTSWLAPALQLTQKHLRMMSYEQ